MSVRYLGTPPPASRLSFYVEHDIGVMVTPNMKNRMEGLGVWPYWAADNGCFSAAGSFDLDEFLDWLHCRRQYTGRCLFAVAPDVLCDARQTWERSRAALPLIRALGYKAALVAQNGLVASDVDWNAFDVLFVGGDDKWKDGEAAHQICLEAARRGKWVHFGRVNSLRRLLLCHLSGADSVDGTFIAFGPDRNLPQVANWLRKVRSQPVLLP